MTTLKLFCRSKHGGGGVFSITLYLKVAFISTKMKIYIYAVCWITLLNSSESSKHTLIRALFANPSLFNKYDMPSLVGQGL